MILNQNATREWSEGPFPKMQVATMWEKEGDGSFFVKFEEGGRFPMHDHLGWEQILMLSGSVRFGNVELVAGDSLTLDEADSHDALAITDATFFVSYRGGIEITG